MIAAMRSAKEAAMARPEKTERFKVTEREAGTGRMVPVAASSGDARALPQSARGESARLEGFEGPVNPNAVDAHVTPASTALAGGVSAVEVLPVDDAAMVPAGAPAQKTASMLAREQELELRGICGNEYIMPAVEAIRRHPEFVDHMKRIRRCESGREFCCHDMDHLLNVARIAYIRVLERKMPFRKEAVYAAALLHDVGKAEQYECGEPHEVAGARVATEILMDVDGFSALEKTAIVAAVAQHRRYDDNASPLGKLLYEADKASRECFACPAREKCDWLPEKMNLGIKI